MKKLLMLAIPLMISMAAQAQPVPVAASAGTLIETATSKPVRGVGGWSEIKHTFSQGDRISLHYDANKQLEYVLVLQGDRNELAKSNASKSGDLQFVVPKSGEVIIRFINDRPGRNAVKYELRKL